MQHCKEKRHVLFPWSTEDLRVVWSTHYPDQPQPATRVEICREVAKHPDLYKAILKHKKLVDAKREYSVLKTQYQLEKKSNKPTKSVKHRKNAVPKSVKKSLKSVKNGKSSKSSKSSFDPWKERDLLPFPSDVVKEIKESRDPNWSDIYRQYADRMIRRQVDEVRDPASYIVPTFEFPWSVPNRFEAVTRFNDDEAYRAEILRTPIAYDFASAFSNENDNDILHLMSYTPWKKESVRHLVKSIVGEDGSLVKYWDKSELLRQYVSNLTPKMTRDIGFHRFAPLTVFLDIYKTFGGRTEFTDSELDNIWANYVLVRTYEMKRSQSFYDLLSSKEDTVLLQTHAGIFLFESVHEVALLKSQDLWFKPVGSDKHRVVMKQKAWLLDMVAANNNPKKEGRSVLMQLIDNIRAFEFFFNSLYMIRQDFRDHAESLVPNFKQTMRVFTVHSAPPPLLAMNPKKFQQYIDHEWARFKVPAVELYPSESTCVSTTNQNKKLFIRPDNAQLFMNDEFTPSSFENGRIIVHSVGSGKTCLAIRIASDFSEAGFRVVWVTKHALRNQVLKNHVSEICNLLIENQYQRISILKGKVEADRWLEDSIPAQTRFQDVMRTLKELGMEWTNLSYRQFSNALEGGNEIGREWKKQNRHDPLKRTLVIIDEAHKMFTGELDRTELPNVSVIHDAFQHSYNTSESFRCRVLFLTATPTTNSVLPLLSMLNMLHSYDVFQYAAKTIDPHITVEEGFINHVAQVRADNREAEVQVACHLFPKMCRRLGKDSEGDEEEDDDEKNAMEYFDTRTITGTNTFKPQELTNHLQEFWSKAVGLISYYDISADYSKFPRTEFARIIMPSATLFQERRMASELLSAGKHELSHIIRRIRQIAAWSKFELVDNPSHRPEKLDRAILQENARTTFFEPSVEDIEQRIVAVDAAIKAEERSEPDPRDAESLVKVKTELERLTAERDTISSSISSSSHSSHQKGLATKKIRKLESHMFGLEQEVSRLENAIQFHDTVKNVKLQFHRKRRERLVRQLEKASRRGAKHEFDFSKITDEKEEEDKTEEDEEKEGKKVEKKKEKKKHKQQTINESDVEETEDEFEYDETELRGEEKATERIKGEYYVKKSWQVVNEPLPKNKPKFPSRHAFDQPDTFDADKFRDDIPLYSPKLDKLLKILEHDDQDCVKRNPEENKHHRLRKRLIFCQDIYDIRAVAGGLMANGWVFGMKRQNVKWKKEFLSTTDNQPVARSIVSKSSQMTWLPDAKGKSDDYKRFLILTRSKMGGVSGCSLNDYAIQLIGSKGEDATYNHPENIHGKLYRVILIDRNFMEGIDLPSTYADLFDAVLSASDRTQIVGRISRFCGNQGLPFVPNYGWPQRVYRYDLKFHTLGLHMSESQQERFGDLVRKADGPYSKLIPPKYADGFIDKIEKNLVSPTELQILLDGNMEMQRIRKKTLDIYVAMMEKASIGALLYAPGMRNLSLTRHELDDLLMDEEETLDEYRREVFLQDEQNRPKINYQLRSVEALKKKWDIHDGPLVSMLQYHVKQAIRNTASEQVSRWKDGTVVKNYFDRYIKPELETAELITVSESHALSVLTQMFSEAVSTKTERLENAKRIRNEKRILRLVKKSKGSFEEAVKLDPSITREEFDRILGSVRFKSRKARKRINSVKSVKSVKSIKTSRKRYSRKATKSISSLFDQAKRDVSKEKRALDIRAIRKSTDLQNEIIKYASEKSGLEPLELQAMFRDWLNKPKPSTLKN